MKLLVVVETLKGMLMLLGPWPELSPRPNRMPSSSGKRTCDVHEAKSERYAANVILLKPGVVRRIGAIQS